MTVCNMSIEAGGRAGLIAPDEVTYAYLEGREHAPRGADLDAAMAFWRGLPTDSQARFDREVALDASEVTPMVTWGTSPEHADHITGTVPDPACAPTAQKRAEMEAALNAEEDEYDDRPTSLNLDRLRRALADSECRSAERIDQVAGDLSFECALK